MNYEFKGTRKCNQRECKEDAVLIIYWPGKVPPPEYCLEHALTAVNILHHMGIEVAREHIKENNE